MKRGIILKCQGNPVSCYGKRSGSEPRSLLRQSKMLSAYRQLSQPKINDDLQQQQEQQSENEQDVVNNSAAQDQDYEQFAEHLIQGCQSGNERTCSRILAMMFNNL